MKPSDIDIDSFYSAHNLAIQSLPKNRLEAEFTGKLTEFLVHELCRSGVQSILSDPVTASSKIKAALDEIQQNKGIEFVTEYRIAVMAALEHTLAARMTYSDMPQSVKESGLYKLDLPDDLMKSK
jgi:hypothetical protein